MADTPVPDPGDSLVRHLIRSSFLALALLTGLWTSALVLYGGIDTEIFGTRITSHDARRTLLYTSLLITVYIVAGGSFSWRALIRRRPVRLRTRKAQAEARLLSLSVHAPAVVAVVASCLLVRLWASGQPMWLDEEMIALNIRDRGFTDLPGLLWLGQTAPLGWLALQRVMLVTIGPSELSLRFVPVLFGIGTLLAAVWVGRRWMNPVSATILALLCTSSYWLGFYFLELKQYSADTFWGLLLPALAAAAVDPPSLPARTRLRRISAWWATAAVGQLFAVGALLVTPACGLALMATQLRRDGWRAVLNAAPAVLVWLISFFGLHYALSLRPAARSAYLRSYWASSMPPATAGVAGTLGWLADQLEPLALGPGGTHWWGTFWLAAAIGLALFWKRSGPGLFYALVVLSGFAWAAFRLVPLSGRVSLWMMPALYVGIALCVEGAAQILRRAFAASRWATFGAAGLIGAVGLSVSMDIFHGAHGLLDGRPASNHELDDRTAVRWLMSRRQPGDALMSTHFGLPALWWYGDIPIGMPGIRAGQHPDGGPVFELKHAWEPCQREQLSEALRDQHRLLVYLGFRFDDVPRGFDELVWLRLREIGRITEYGEFAERSRAAVVDLTPGSASSVALAGDPGPPNRPSRLDGCLYVYRARRAWSW